MVVVVVVVDVDVRDWGRVGGRVMFLGCVGVIFGTLRGVVIAVVFVRRAGICLGMLRIGSQLALYGGSVCCLLGWVKGAVVGTWKVGELLGRGERRWYRWMVRTR